MSKTKRILILVFATILVLGLVVLLCTSAKAPAADPVNQAALDEVYYYTDMADVSASYTHYHLRCMGFTEEEAKAAIAAAKVDWEEEALYCGLEFLEYHSEADLEELIDWLETAGFTESEILIAIRLIYGKG